MFMGTWSSGTCPGPSTMLWTPASRALRTRWPSVISSVSCAWSEASSMHPGLKPSPSDSVNSYLRAISNR